MRLSLKCSDTPSSIYPDQWMQGDDDGSGTPRGCPFVCVPLYRACPDLRDPLACACPLHSPHTSHRVGRRSNVACSHAAAWHRRPTPQTPDGGLCLLLRPTPFIFPKPACDCVHRVRRRIACRVVSAAKLGTVSLPNRHCFVFRVGRRDAPRAAPLACRWHVAVAGSAFALGAGGICALRRFP